MTITHMFEYAMVLGERPAEQVRADLFEMLRVAEHCISEGCTHLVVCGKQRAFGELDSVAVSGSRVEQDPPFGQPGK